MTTLRILGLSGSFRQASLNTALLRACQELLPAGAELVIHDYRDVPLYDADLEKPASVVRLEQAIAASDGLLLAVPEYNYSLPGVLKNALDWASRPAYKSVFRDKPVGVLSASGSLVGGARGQGHTKQILLGMAAQVFPWPEVLVAQAGAKFTDGRLTDDATREALTRALSAFVPWVARVRPSAAG